MAVDCPIECVKDLCQGDFLGRNGAWMLAIVGSFITCVGVVLTYFLKSRCKKIECCGIKCDRDVVQLNVKDGTNLHQVSNTKGEK